MLNKIMLPADADAQRARLTSAGTALTGHLAETGSASAGLVVRIRPWLVSRCHAGPLRGIHQLYPVALC